MGNILSSVIRQPDGIEETCRFENIIGLSNAEFESVNAEYDIYKLIASYDSESESPSDFGGVSGGGLWQIILRKSANGEINCDYPFLSGVAYRQTSLQKNERSILCHGRKTIYELVYSAIDNL